MELKKLILSLEKNYEWKLSNIFLFGFSQVNKIKIKYKKKKKKKNNYIKNK